MTGELDNYDFYKVKKSKLFSEQLEGRLSLAEVSGSEGLPSIKKAFCNDLRGLLALQDINHIIQMVFEIERILSELKDMNIQEENFPSLGEFYRNLSPILLRSLWENSSDSDFSKIWLESIRVGIEEELYFWQEN